MKRRVSVWMCTVFLTAACGESGGRDVAVKTVTVADIIDRTGPAAATAAATTEAIKLSISDVNAGLKKSKEFQHVQFKLVTGDNKSDATVARERALDAVRNQGAKVLITTTSSDDIFINTLNYDADPDNDLNVPILCTACTSSSINHPQATGTDPVNEATLRNGKGWNYRLIMNSALQTKVLVRIALATGNNGDVNNDGQFKVVVYAGNEAFGQAFAAGIAEAAQALHPSPAPLVEKIFFDPKADPNSYDWHSDIAKLVDRNNENTQTADGNPDVIIEAAFPGPSIALTKAYIEGQYNVRLLHSLPFRAEATVIALGDAVNGQEGASSVAHENNASGMVFASEYETATGMKPDALGAQKYDAGILSALATLVAMKENGLTDATAVTGAQIRDALKKVNDPAGEIVRTGPEEFARAADLIASGKAINFDGASGPLDFDEYGRVLNRLAHFRVENKRFVDVQTFDCVSSPDCPLFQ